MTINANIVLDSISPRGVRLTTMQLTYPRFIHGEFMTHRVFSRNASSSRAIPVNKLINLAIEDPAFFTSVRYNEAGMQGQTELTPEDRERFFSEWCYLRDVCAAYARRWSAKVADGGYNIHKQHVNRVMEPWHHIKVVCTSTKWDNFFALRDHPAAEPTIRSLAHLMHEAHNHSKPVQLEVGQWHLPYVTDYEQTTTRFSDEFLLKLSTARCARVSYMRHDGTPAPYEEDVALHDRLVFRAVGDDDPKHMSPAEHQAQVSEFPHSAYCGNFHGDWDQYRRHLELRS